MIPRPKILFTAFRPFTGRAVNGSETIVKFLKTWKSPYTIKTIIMDVIWGEVERTGLAAIKAFCPDMVLALGEGEPGVVSIETAGLNLRSGTDNAGVAATGELEPGGPARRLSRFCCSMTDCQDYAFPVSISTDAGLYLCNNALYSFLGTDVRRVLFAHLPPQGKAPNKKYIGSTFPIVKDLLKSNFPWIK
jgi:pyrrolidone-carboxylate peptidase